MEGTVDEEKETGSGGSSSSDGGVEA